MLPLELLKVIFGALSRDDLDALMLSGALFRDVVFRYFADEPFRHFADLHIWGHQLYEFGLITGNLYTCQDSDEFSRRMRLSRVDRLRLNIDLNEDLYNILLPHMDAWRDGYVQSPLRFDAPSLFERAFNELLFCKTMRFSTDFDGQLSRSFLSFATVRECTLLVVSDPPRPLTASDILEWLNVDARSQEPKRLKVDDAGLADSVENLVGQLKTDFVEANTARRYVVKIFVGEYGGQAGRIFSKDTSEMLLISRGTDNAGIDYVEVERKTTDATDEKQ